jgi:alpha-D-xyloside xylohydrolase
MLVRDGTAIPVLNLAQSTSQMDWARLGVRVFAKEAPVAKGLVCLPADNQLHEITLNKNGGTFKLGNDVLNGKVTWQVLAMGD